MCSISMFLVIINIIILIIIISMDASHDFLLIQNNFSKLCFQKLTVAGHEENSRQWRRLENDHGVKNYDQYVQHNLLFF